jgi:hypothetical protein
LFLVNNVTMIRTCIYSILMISTLSPFAQDVDPGKLEFRRQAVQRMIFDKTQNIPLAGLFPAKIVGLDVMHPPVGEQVNNPQLMIENGKLKISSEQNGKTTRYVGGFNPFATYDVAINKFNGSGEIGLVFGDTNTENKITATLVVVDGINQSINYIVTKDGQEAESNNFMLPNEFIDDKPIRLRVQMLAVCANFFVERAERSTLIGQMDFVKYSDLRRKDKMHNYEYLKEPELYLQIPKP